MLRMSVASFIEPKTPSDIGRTCKDIREWDSWMQWLDKQSKLGTLRFIKGRWCVTDSMRKQVMSWA